jgi:hypothetical protein
LFVAPSYAESENPQNNIRMQACGAAWQSLGTTLDHVMKQIKTLHKWKLDVF